jgi:hypothetical protein
VPTTLGDTLKFRIIIGYDDLHVMQSCRRPRLPPQRYIHRETALTGYHKTNVYAYIIYQNTPKRKHYSLIRRQTPQKNS